MLPLVTENCPLLEERFPANVPLAPDISPVKDPPPVIESPPVRGALNIAVPAEL